MIKKHLTATVIVAVAIIIFPSSILNALTNFLLAGALPVLPFSLPSWMMFLLASITLVAFLRWLAIYQLNVTIPQAQKSDKKASVKTTRVKTSRPKPKPAS